MLTTTILTTVTTPTTVVIIITTETALTTTGSTSWWTEVVQWSWTSRGSRSKRPKSTSQCPGTGWLSWRQWFCWRHWKTAMMTVTIATNHWPPSSIVSIIIIVIASISSLISWQQLLLNVVSFTTATPWNLKFCLKRSRTHLTAAFTKKSLSPEIELSSVLLIFAFESFAKMNVR